jgi:serine/threonine-protein kinase
MSGDEPKVIGRYAIFGELASGGMATVHLGRLLGPVGFSRIVAIKRLHDQFAADPEFVSMFLDEARLAARVRHPNVVQTLDVVAADGKVFLVMDLVHGESLAQLIRAAAIERRPIDSTIVAAILSGALHGLHAAHEATGEDARPLGIVHRDVSPQNILVGLDGVARVLDFGIAKATMQVSQTASGTLKGKIAYMAPEQLTGGKVTRRTDIFAAGIVLWEAIARRRLFQGPSGPDIVMKVLSAPIPPPSHVVEGVSAALDEIVLRALEREPESRYATAREMAIDLQRRVGIAAASDVGEWVELTARDPLAKRAQRVAEIEQSEDLVPVASVRPGYKLRATSVPEKETNTDKIERTNTDEIEETNTDRIEGTITDRIEATLLLPAVADSTSRRTMPMPVVPAVHATQPDTTRRSLRDQRPADVRRRGLWVIPVVAILAVAVLAAVVVGKRSRGATARAQAPAPSASAVERAPANGEDVPFVAVLEADGASTTPAPPSSVGSATPAASNASTGRGAAARQQRTTGPPKVSTREPGATASPSPPPHDPCDPPFSIDENGKHYKPECLRSH